MNIMIANTISSCITLLTQNIPIMIEKIFFVIKLVMSLICHSIFSLAKIEIVGTIDADLKINFPVEYYAIIDKIKNLKNLEEIRYVKKMYKIYRVFS
jgi:hypothetical protein